MTGNKQELVRRTKETGPSVLVNDKDRKDKGYNIIHNPTLKSLSSPNTLYLMCHVHKYTHILSISYISSMLMIETVSYS